MGRLALALGGGGSKGMFQMGAWKAFREIGIEFHAISGTSIGAVNGALMLGTEYESALEMWNNLKMDQCLAFSQNQQPKSADLLSLKNANLLMRELWNNRALNTGPLRNLLKKYICEYQVRTSTSDYGLLTTLMPDFKPNPMWRSDIPEGKLIDYIMASARLPGLAPVSIDGHTYLDGGIVQNVPISMLRSKGYRHIVAIDLEAKASVPSNVDDNTQITLIHDRQDLGGFLDITPAVLQRNFQLGYLDTLKAFDQLNGDYYSFCHNEYKNLLDKYGFETLDGLEQAALIYEVDRCRIYSSEDFTLQIKQNRKKFQKEYDEKRKSMQIENKLRAFASGKLKVLNLLPPMKLAFLMEIKAGARENGSSPKFPLRLFGSLDKAAEALCAICSE